jgi:hypothetical protein
MSGRGSSDGPAYRTGPSPACGFVIDERVEDLRPDLTARGFHCAHRVLRPDGRAVIEDMSADASNADIAAEVAGMELSATNRLITQAVLRFLRRRAYGRTRLEDLAVRSHFGGGTITTQNIGITLTLTRR